MPVFAQTLHEGFLDAAAKFPDRPALEVHGNELTYSQLRARAMRIAAALGCVPSGSCVPLTAVFAHRSETAYAGVLGALMAGHGYVPLNRSFPVDRTRSMLQRSEAQSVIVDHESAAHLDGVLAGLDERLLILIPDGDVSELRRRWPDHTFLGARELAATDVGRTEDEVALEGPDSIAYLLFTSGSTGLPKGVPITHRNVMNVVRVLGERYDVDSDDRLSQTFDLTFDLSVFDMFVAWHHGACVCCPEPNDLLAPAQYIRRSRLTMWFSVPSVGVFMRKLRMLKPDSYPLLRWALFCGEPLPEDVAAAWAEAAPNATVENLYGPTEATIACTVYRWDGTRSPRESALGLVPIGDPFPDMRVMVVDDELRSVRDGDEGELLLAGVQLASGYWCDPSKTSLAFVHVGGTEEVHYRTGDRVRRSPEHGPLQYVGRLDNQIKVNGHRVELGEVEAAVRKASGIDAVIGIGWPRTPSGAGGVVAFVGSLDVDVAATQQRVAACLPDYMRPRAYRLLDSLPTNPNGKFDRNALLALLSEETT